MKKTLAIMMLSVFLFACFASGVSEGSGDTYPNDSVITWYTMGVGSVSDTLARIIAPKLGENLGQTIIIENAGGAGGMNMTNPVFLAEADGYTICSATGASMLLSTHNSKCIYTIDDFIFLASLLSQPQCIAVAADAPFDTFEGFLDYIKANPGTVKIGCNGASTIPNIVTRALIYETGLDFATVQYDSEAEAIAAVLGGHILGTCLGVSTVKANLDAGTMKMIVYTTPDVKTPGYEDVPTLKSLGYYATGIRGAQGLAIKAGTPENRVKMISDALEKTLKDPEIIEQLKAANLWYEGGIMYYEEYNKVMRENYVYMNDVLTKTGLMTELYKK